MTNFLFHCMYLKVFFFSITYVLNFKKIKVTKNLHLLLLENTFGSHNLETGFSFTFATTNIQT